MSTMGRREVFVVSLGLLTAGKIGYEMGFGDGSRVSRVEMVPVPPEKIETDSTLFTARDVSDQLRRNILILADQNENLLDHAYCHTLKNSGLFPSVRAAEMRGLESVSITERFVPLAGSNINLFRLSAPPSPVEFIHGVYVGNRGSTYEWHPLPNDSFSVVNAIAVDLTKASSQSGRYDVVLTGVRADQQPLMADELELRYQKDFNLVIFGRNLIPIVAHRLIGLS